MNQEKMGNFIAELRREKGLTQKDIALKLNISDNSVSKWERGINAPDISCLTMLAELFGVTVNEILNGEYNYKSKVKDYTKLKKVIEINDITKKYGKKVVLNHLSLNVYEGEVVGLIGANGIGKTTLIKCILNFCKTNAGEIKIFNMNIKKDYEQIMNDTSAIIEHPDFYLNLSGLDNIKIVSLLNGINDDDYIKYLIKNLKLEKDINKKVKEYSLGMKQRLGVICALIKRPKLLILDEPTNGLDPIGINEFRSIIKNLNLKENTTILISSHILSEIENICDRILIMDKGKIIKDIEIANLKHNHKSLEKEFLEVISKRDYNENN